jgi:hypothetical protein
VPRLFVPKANRDAIKDLLTLDRSQFDSLMSALRQLPEAKGEHHRLSNQSVQGVPKEKSENILDTIEMLYRIWSSRGNQLLDGFIEDLGKLCTGGCAERLAVSGHGNRVQRMEVE